MKEIIARLIKDPINNGLAQFDHAQSNSKKWPNGLKDKISSNKFFSRKTTKKQLFHVPISTFHSAKFFKKSLWVDSELWGCAPFSEPNKIAHLSWTKNFLVQTIVITFIYLLALFIVQNLKKFLQRIQSYEDVPFLGPKWSICPKQIFFGKLLISFSSTY